ncbi:branched-chain amino acid ABC transporter permease [Microbacterium kribbense]|uniref:branched-chain amino acid ABC transporter permease n=1 Tax=Microbacterium kribbense TaxID=433645 RepID=UPI0031DBCF5A
MIIVVGPVVLPEELIGIGALCALYVIAGVGLQQMMGDTGQVSFGQGAFWAIGAYGVGILTVKAHLPVIPAIIIGVLITGVVAFAIGWPLTQLRGHYLAVATLALAMIVADLANNLIGVTGGSTGLPGVPLITLFGEPMIGTPFYILCWIVALVVLVGASNLSTSRTGRAFRAVGRDDSGSQALGIPSAGYRLRSFVLAAMLAGGGGALYATYLGFLSPDAFSVQLSVLLLIIVVVGGLASPYGALLGAVVVTVLSQWLTAVASNPSVPVGVGSALDPLLYGGAVFLILRFLPSGLQPPLRRIAGGSVTGIRRLMGRDTRSVEPREGERDADSLAPAEVVPTDTPARVVED